MRMTRCPPISLGPLRFLKLDNKVFGYYGKLVGTSSTGGRVGCRWGYTHGAKSGWQHFLRVQLGSKRESKNFHWVYLNIVDVAESAKSWLRYADETHPN